jgi:hypothetical protein
MKSNRCNRAGLNRSQISDFDIGKGITRLVISHHPKFRDVEQSGVGKTTLIKHTFNISELEVSDRLLFIEIWLIML